jgi:hypothetical protein
MLYLCIMKVNQVFNTILEYFKQNNIQYNNINDGIIISNLSTCENYDKCYINIESHLYDGLHFKAGDKYYYDCWTNYEPTKSESIVTVSQILKATRKQIIDDLLK